jgi:outer membrane murein-binding lipoprotein Lpp
VKREIIHYHHHHSANEVPRWAFDLHRKLDLINERLNHMATAEQVAKLTADVKALTNAIDAYQAAVTAAISKAQAASADPAIDALDATITAETTKLTSAMPG